MLADAGIASRRASEALVEEGAVTVNGKVQNVLKSGTAFGTPNHFFPIF